MTKKEAPYHPKRPSLNNPEKLPVLYSIKVFWLIFKIPIDVYFTSGNKLGNSEILHATLLILFVS